MKKIMIIIFICFLSTIVVGCNDSIKNLELSSEGLSYTSLENNTCSVSGYSGSKSNVLIPRDYNGCLVTTIDNYAFKGATSLTTITIPDSVITIDKFAFEGATNLTSINVDVDNSVYSSKDGVLFDKNETLIISYPASKEETIYTIPDSVTELGCYVFSGATSLTSIIIPKSVTEIGWDAFSGAVSLTSINVEVDNSVYSSKDGVLFNKNQTLIISYPASKNGSNYLIPDSVITVNPWAFKGVTSLTSIIIPNSVITIGYSAFCEATSLTTVIFEEGSQLTNLGYYTFSGATSLTSITIPDSVVKIGVYAFEGTTSLTSINVEIENPQYSSKDGVLFDKDQTLIITYPAGKNETAYIIPNSVTTIGSRSFEGTTSLASITIPNSVTTIDRYAFLSALNITSIILTATTPPSIIDLGITNEDLKIYVPSDYISDYRLEWSHYISIIYPISS